MSIISMKVAPGIYISGELLKRAGITRDEVEVEILENLIRIYQTESSVRTGPLAKNSPLWEDVAMGEIHGSNGKDNGD